MPVKRSKERILNCIMSRETERDWRLEHAVEAEVLAAPVAITPSKDLRESWCHLSLHKKAGFFLVLSTSLLIGLNDARAQGFELPCTLPFDEIKEIHPIDDSCGIEGVGSSDAHLAQNRAKNNFCATGTPVRVTYNNFLRLQQAAEKKSIPFGSSNSLPEDRSVLRDVYITSAGKKLGEGTLVRYVAFIVDAHHSNLKKGESVNCKKGGEETNDIHIALGRTPDDDPCDTVTAEISPHFRPSSWDELEHTGLDGRPVRVTGQLFFDASHKPCTKTKRASPPRASIWEIHPVYGIDVCKSKSLTSCKANDESVWIPLHEWHAVEEEQDE